LYYNIFNPPRKEMSKLSDKSTTNNTMTSQQQKEFIDILLKFINKASESDDRDMLEALPKVAEVLSKFTT